MYEIKEMYGSIYCADASSGEILYEITEPAVLFSATPTPVVLKLGNKDKLESIYIPSDFRMQERQVVRTWLRIMCWQTCLRM